MVWKVYPVFVLDPHFAKPEFVGVLRYNFLLEVCAAAAPKPGAC